MSNENCVNYDHTDDGCRGIYCENCAVYHSQIINEIREELFAKPVLVFYSKSGIESKLE